MARLVVLDCPDAEEQRILNRFAELHGFTGVDAQGQAQNKTQFMKAKLMQYVRDCVKSQEVVKAARDAEAAARAQPEVTLS
jgi:hypothetical protein